MALENFGSGYGYWPEVAKRLTRFQPGPKEPPSEWLIMIYACVPSFRAVGSIGHRLVLRAKTGWVAFLTKVISRKKPDLDILSR
jgi:hypothetical protein